MINSAVKRPGQPHHEIRARASIYWPPSLLTMPARDVLLIRVFEAAVHTWDVSRAIGFDERIDERLAMLTYPLVERLIHVPATRAFFASPQNTLPSTATPQDRLLHLAGRKP